jgi:DNA-directed RNA polymerase II subunit RPB2
MTIGQLVECIFGKIACMAGGFGDSTAFRSNGIDFDLFKKELINYGFNSSGNEVLYDGLTGEQLTADIFIGPTYYMRLKHMVKDKVNYRSKGPVVQLTRQPTHGKAKDGGLRLGEMERDGLIAHGISKFVNESYTTKSDEYYLAICNNTGTIAIYNESTNLFMSPIIDGPVRFKEIIDSSGKKNFDVENISRHGTSFSIVRVPYCFKQLMYELTAMNIQMRIITDDNVNKLINHGNSYFGIEGSLDEVYDKYLSILNKNISSIKKNKPDKKRSQSMKKSNFKSTTKKNTKYNSLVKTVLIKEF